MKPLVIYHNRCDDGFAAFVTASLALGSVDGFAADYNSHLPDVTGRSVYIIDFSVPPETLKEWTEKATSIIWLDHHKTAFEAVGFDPQSRYHGTFYDGKIQYILDPNMSGAGLAWQWFFPEQDVPIPILHIQDNDLWRFEHTNTKSFMRALRSQPRTLDVWISLFDDMAFPDRYDAFIKQGDAIERFFWQSLEYCLEGSTQNVMLLDAPGLAVNISPCFTSEAGHVLAKLCGSYALLWYLDAAGIVHCSLRSVPEFDVSVIAKHFGGGGHKTAAGFKMTAENFRATTGIML